MTTLSELLPAGGGGNEVEFVASGTLPNGKPVVLKSNGQVEVVAQTSISQNFNNSFQQVQSGDVYGFEFAFDPSNPDTFVAVYRDNANNAYGTLIAGVVSGSTISFGSEVVYKSSNSYDGRISFDPNVAGSFVIAATFSGSSNIGNLIAGSLSGNTITIGGAVAVTGSSGASPNFDISFNPKTAGQFVIVYSDPQYSNKKVRLCSVSGTTLTVGSSSNISNGLALYVTVNFNPAKDDTFIVIYREVNSGHGVARVGTVSGSSVSFTNDLTWLSATVNYVDFAFDIKTANRIVIVYTHQGNSQSGTAKIGSVISGGINYGSASIFHSGVMSNARIAFNPNTAHEFVVYYRPDSDSNRAAVKIGNSSGSTATFGSATRLGSDVPTTGNAMCTAFLPDLSEKFVVSGYDDTNKTFTRVQQLATTATNLTESSFVGTSTAAYTNGQTAKIMLQGGVSTNQSSLAIGSTYYVQPNGTLATSAGTPSVIAGKAVKATTLLLKGI